jgi:hypothetical protein
MRYLALFLCVLSMSAHAFKIEQKHDEFTKASYIRASDLKLCQIKSAGFAAQCASLDLVWMPDEPETVAIRLEQNGISGISQVAVNINGQIQRFGADLPTDFDYNRSIGRASSTMAWSSANVFVLPVAALKGIAADQGNGIMRVTGIHASTDYDFYRKAKARGVPADELRKFLDAISKSSPAPAPAE